MCFSFPIIELCIEIKIFFLLRCILAFSLLLYICISVMFESGILSYKSTTDKQTERIEANRISQVIQSNNQIFKHRNYNGYS